MRQFCKTDIKDIYNKLVDVAKKALKKNDYNASAKFIREAAKWAYNTNIFYYEPELEILLKTLSDKYLQKKEIIPNINKYILLDTEAIDNRGLTQQYIKAMIANKIEFQFITLQTKTDLIKDTLSIIKSYQKANIIIIKGVNNDDVLLARTIQNEIYKFSPEKILLHIKPWDVTSLLAIHSITGSKIYNINMTDHAFWLGASFIDYNIEFRPYGMTISKEQRGLKDNQLLPMPFYPITSGKNTFEGFPNETIGKIIIFTGGSPYKMYDKEQTFLLKIIDSILSLSDKTVVLLAGVPKNNPIIIDAISKMDNSDRLIFLGTRKDINEVFNHCDIYLNTYPVEGGLMLQYAATNAKPIISYTNNAKGRKEAVESFVNHYNDSFNTFTDIKDVINYTRNLLYDSEFRKNEGLKNKESVMNEDSFNHVFYQTIMSNKNQFLWTDLDIDYESISNLYIEQENNTLHTGYRRLVQIFKMKLYILFPKYAWNTTYFLIEMIKRKIKDIMK